MPHDHGRIAASVVHALDVYLRTLGPDSGRLTTTWDADGDPSPLTPSVWEELRERLGAAPTDDFLDDLPRDSLWFDILTRRRFDANVRLTGDESDSSGYEFRYRSRLPWRNPSARMLSVLSVHVPLRFLEEQGASRLRELALELAGSLPFSTAHAGLSFASSRAFWKSLPLLKADLLRHPGWAVPAAGTSMDMGPQVDGIHWLNFLGPPLLETVGGLQALRSHLSHPETSVQELTGGRALISLGPAPLAGDTKLGETLPAYRELARFLEPWLLPFPHVNTWDGYTDEEARLWWRRFLEAPPEKVYDPRDG
nr:type VI immunity family protein [Corallococcus sp. AS-1-12]